MAALEAFDVQVSPPEEPGEGYVLIRYYRQDERPEQGIERPDAELTPLDEIRFQAALGYRAFDEVRYYPGPAGGLVHYLRIVNGAGPYDGKWYRATPAGDAAMRALLASNGVDLEAPGTPAAGDRAAVAALGGGAGLVLGAAALAVVRRRHALGQGLTVGG
jgi:hypothetical protein